MSAALISRMGVQHDFRDDLESSVYVLLWVTLSYSEVSEKEFVRSILSSVFDPQPCGATGGYSKSDFLQARTFLRQVSFPNRPQLHKLIFELAQLFAVRYEPELSKDEREAAKTLKSSDNPGLQNAYLTSRAYQYEERMSQLRNHSHTIELFDQALRDHSQWPTNDVAVKQFHPNPPSRPITKTGWNSTLFIEGLKIKSNGESLR